MSAPYSYDLRQKVLQAIDKGEKKSSVCRMFNISRNTLWTWLKRKQETGDVVAKTNYHRGVKPKIEDLEEFKQFAQKYGHLTQQEMASLWRKPVSKTLIAKALKKIGFTRKKKNLWLSRKKRGSKAKVFFENQRLFTRKICRCR